MAIDSAVVALYFPLVFPFFSRFSLAFLAFVSGRKTATHIWPEKHGPLAMHNDIYVCVSLCVCDVFTHRKFSPFNARISRHFTLVKARSTFCS